MTNQYLLGIDLGSSSVKAALTEAETGQLIATAQSPADEMLIEAPYPGWAEQYPDDWWFHTCSAIRKVLSKSGMSGKSVGAVGISYQMHGLVAVDEHGRPLRPAIIWCDSRAADIGRRALEAMGADLCLSHLLNSPGNFTASKLRWVRENEPDVYRKIYKFLLPGDYLAYRLTGRMCTTLCGLSEGTLWDFRHHQPAQLLLEYFDISPDLIPAIVPVFSEQGRLTSEAAAATNLAPGTPVNYRAGDQPNNALSLGVLNPGEVAATGGTSGVIYAVSDQLTTDPTQRFNAFAHVNHRKNQIRIGQLLCINGAGSFYRWVRRTTGAGKSYQEMENEAAKVPPGAHGLLAFPFGNGVERMFANRNAPSGFVYLDINRHSNATLYRAALEGVAFAFVYGMEILSQTGVPLQHIRAGNDNLFQSKIFSQTIADLSGCTISLYATNGAAGAARAAHESCRKEAENFLKSRQSAFPLVTFYPDSPADSLSRQFELWKKQILP